MKKVILLLILIVISAAMFAQDTAVADTIGGGVGGAFDGILNTVGFWITVVVAILEVVARVIPSAANWSPLSNVLTLLQKILNIIPNKAANGGKFVQKDTIVK